MISEIDKKQVYERRREAYLAFTSNGMPEGICGDAAFLLACSHWNVSPRKAAAHAFYKYVISRALDWRDLIHRYILWITDNAGYTKNINGFRHGNKCDGRKCIGKEIDCIRSAMPRLFRTVLNWIYPNSEE